MQNKIIKTELVAWRQLEWLQGDLKQMSEVSFTRLKRSLTDNDFVMAFNVWDDNGKLWILDGHHRKKALESLVSEGVVIPDLLPANFIDCKSVREAKKLVLIYSSVYANVASEDVLYAFLYQNQIEWKDVEPSLDLPQIDVNYFTKGWIEDDTQHGATSDQFPPETSLNFRDNKSGVHMIELLFASEAEQRATALWLRELRDKQGVESTGMALYKFIQENARPGS